MNSPARSDAFSNGVTGMTLLSPYRVLDLTDERGQLAGMILAQLGAEVIAVEPPGGSRSRRIGPFAREVVDAEHSLRHWAYNRGKRSVVLDLDGSAQDRDALRRLAAGADVLIESAGPGVMAALGLGPAELAEAAGGLAAPLQLEPQGFFELGMRGRGDQRALHGGAGFQVGSRDCGAAGPRRQRRNSRYTGLSDSST